MNENKSIGRNTIFSYVHVFMLIIFKQNFVPIKFGITMFLTDFIIRVFVNPKYSPTLIIGRLIVGRQNPEYVGAAQKRLRG